MKSVRKEIREKFKGFRFANQSAMLKNSDALRPRFRAALPSFRRAQAYHTKTSAGRPHAVGRFGYCLCALVRGGRRRSFGAARKSSGKRKYGKAASKRVESAMRRRKKGTLKSGRSGKTVKSRKQAIAIGLSEARKKGAKVPRKRSSRKRSSR